ncbi:MAG: class B sortase [Eubacteriaceae bacterium]|nr:class B sortase [Eubacteriaceae bacterium]
MNEEKSPFETPENDENVLYGTSTDEVNEIDEKQDDISEINTSEDVTDVTSEEIKEDDVHSEEVITKDVTEETGDDLKSETGDAPSESAGETALTKTDNSVAAGSNSKEKKSKKSKKRKKRLLDALLVFCIVGLMVSGYFLMSDILPRIENMKNIKDIQQVSPIIDTEKDTSRIPSIEYLKEINKDIIGWINIPNTNVDFPVLQCSNNDYYLQYSYTEKWNDAGSIFVDFRNSDDFTDQNTVIYGHARYDGTMFAQVLHYKKQAQYKKAPFITIVLEGKVYYYQIFSANIVPADYDYREADYGKDFMKHIKAMRKDSMIKSSAVVNEDSKIITLSTCTNVIEDGRLALLAVLLNPDGEKIDLSQYPL